jgi:hypothetical protein
VGGIAAARHTVTPPLVDSCVIASSLFCILSRYWAVEVEARVGGASGGGSSGSNSGPVDGEGGSTHLHGELDLVLSHTGHATGSPSSSCVARASPKGRGRWRIPHGSKMVVGSGGSGVGRADSQTCAVRKPQPLASTLGYVGGRRFALPPPCTAVPRAARLCTHLPEAGKAGSAPRAIGRRRQRASAATAPTGGRGSSRLAASTAPRTTRREPESPAWRSSWSSR